jgi:hypothetical protein
MTTTANQWHRRSKGKGPCSICGCPSNIRAYHRLTTEKEKANQGPFKWVCWYVTGYGQSYEEAWVREDGVKIEDVAWTDPEAPDLPRNEYGDVITSDLEGSERLGK